MPRRVFFTIYGTFPRFDRGGDRRPGGGGSRRGDHPAPLEDGQYFGLKQVAATIWRLLESPRTIREIEGTLLEEYDIGPDICHEEVVGLLSDLIDQGLVEVTEHDKA